MIKIIKEGKKPIKTKTVWKFTCVHCGCEFECESSDFKLVERRLGGDRVVDCPCCGHELHTNKNFYTTHEMPEDIAELI